MGNNPSSPTVTFTNLAYTIVPGDIINIAFIDLSNVNPNVWRIGSIGAFAYAGSYFQILCPGANTVCYGINTIPVQWTPSYSSTTPQIFNVSFNGRTLTSVYSRIQAPANSVPNSLYLQWDAIYNQGQTCGGNAQPCSGAQGVLGQQSPPTQSTATVTMTVADYGVIPYTQPPTQFMVGYFNSLPCNGVNKNMAFGFWASGNNTLDATAGFCPGATTSITLPGGAPVTVLWNGQLDVSGLLVKLAGNPLTGHAHITRPFCSDIPSIVWQTSQKCGQTLTDTTGALREFFGVSQGAGLRGAVQNTNTIIPVAYTSYAPPNQPQLWIASFNSMGCNGVNKQIAVAIWNNSTRYMGLCVGANTITLAPRIRAHIQWDGQFGFVVTMSGKPLPVLNSLTNNVPCSTIPPIVFQRCGQTLTDTTGALRQFVGAAQGTQHTFGPQDTFGISPPIQSMASVSISFVTYQTTVPPQIPFWIGYFNSLPCNGINKAIAFAFWGAGNTGIILCPQNNTILPEGVLVNIQWNGQLNPSAFSPTTAGSNLPLPIVNTYPNAFTIPCFKAIPIISLSCGLTDTTGRFREFAAFVQGLNVPQNAYSLQGVSTPQGASTPWAQGVSTPGGIATRTTYYPANAPDLTVLTFPHHGTLHAFAVNGNSATHLPPNQPTMIGRYALHWDGRVVHAKYGGVSITSRSESISMHATTMQQLSAIPMGSTNAMPGVVVNSAQPSYAKPITQPRYALTPNDNNMTIDASRRDMVVEFPDSLPEGMQVQITRVDASKHKVKLPALAGRKDNLYLNTCDCHKSIQLQKRGGAWGVL